MVVAFLLSLTGSVQAAETNQGKSETFANVNLGAKITSQEGAKITIALVLNNGDAKVQPQLKYSVRLMNRNFVEDEKLYDELITLAPNQTIRKEIVYEAPAYLKGSRELWVYISNPGSAILGLTKVGDVTFAGNGEYLDILGDSCYLTISGENQKYTTWQGVDVSAEEELSGICNIENKFQKEITVTPSVETFWRTSRGKSLSKEEIAPITLKAGEKKEFSFVISKAKDPQAYDAVLSFKDASGKLISNKAIFHYVLRGASATINNVRLDKDQYAKGETAKLSLSWYPSADGFAGSRAGKGTSLSVITAEVIIRGSDGKNCSKTVTQSLENGQSVSELLIPIENDCVNPIVEVALKDGNGKVLDQNGFSLENESDPLKMGGINVTEEKESTSNIPKFLWYLFGILPIAVLTWIIYRKGKTGNQINSVLLVLLFVISGTLMFGQRASALSWSWYDATNGSNGNYVANLSLSAIGNHVFAPGEAMTISGSGTDGYCANGLTAINMNWSMVSIPPTPPLPPVGPKQPNPGGTVFAFNNNPTLCSIEPPYCGSTSGSVSTNAPLTPGSYRISFCGFSSEGGCAPDKYIDITVADPNAPGACGLATTKEFSAAPAITEPTLCAAGTLSPSGIGYTDTHWTWTCKSMGTGADSPLCLANKSMVPEAEPVCIGTDSRVDVSWTVNPGQESATGYWVDVSEDEGFSWFWNKYFPASTTRSASGAPAGYGSVNTALSAPTNLEAGKPYHVRVYNYSKEVWSTIAHFVARNCACELDPKIYNCTNPIPDCQGQCGTSVKRDPICTYTNKCGTFPEPDVSKCDKPGNPCIAKTNPCTCPKKDWIEVTP